MIKDLEYKGKFTKKVEEIFKEDYEFEELTDYIIKIGNVAGLGKLKEFKLQCYSFTNKYDMQEENAELYFYFEKGKIEIFDGLKCKSTDVIKYIRIYDNNDKLISEYENEKLEEFVEKFEDEVFYQLGGLPSIVQTIIEELLKEKEVYVIDTTIDLNKFNAEERKILKQALKILQVA